MNAINEFLKSIVRDCEPTAESGSQARSHFLKSVPTLPGTASANLWAAIGRGQRPRRYYFGAALPVLVFFGLAVADFGANCGVTSLVR